VLSYAGLDLIRNPIVVNTINYETFFKKLSRQQLKNSFY